jgi:uncharacterized protein (TIGR02246 family)
VTKSFWLYALLLTVLPSGVPSQSKARPEDEAAIKRVIQQWHESFEKRDANARTALLTENTIFINAFGVEREGKQNVATFWKELFASGTFDQSTVVVPKENMRFLAADIAIVDRFEDVTGQRGVETGKPLPPRKVHLTFVLVKSSGRWLVAYYRAGDLRDPETAR